MANHTFTHGWNRGLYTNTNTFMDAIKKQEALIKEKTGITTNIARFPGGSSTPGATKGKAMKQALKEAGYGWVDWTASDGDGGYLKDYATGMSNLKKTLGEKIEVVLFHDYHQVTTAMLPEVIKYLRDNNYIILPLFYDSVMVNKG
jgi:peptidoglycan/xylan/chitin deacetylase (PgdA/CDA1 family)